MSYGLDFSFARPGAAAIKAAGYSFVNRYLSWLPNGKVISAYEYNYYLKNGIDVQLNWEFAANDALRGSAGGVQDATEAVRQAKLLGYPRGATIQFSYDVDYQTSVYPTLVSYGRSARVVLNNYGYRFGGYGSYSVLKHLFDMNVLQDGWQTYAWSYGAWESRAHLRQIQNGVSVGGGEVDRNITSGPVYTANHPYGDPIHTEDDEMTKDERAAVMTAQAIAYAQAMGADTFWMYPPNGEPRKSVSMKAYWDKIKSTVKLP